MMLVEYELASFYKTKFVVQHTAIDTFIFTLIVDVDH